MHTQINYVQIGDKKNDAVKLHPHCQGGGMKGLDTI